MRTKTKRIKKLMDKFNKISRPYSRCVLGDNGLLIKEQSRSLVSGQETVFGESDNEDDRSSYQSSSVFETASLISCVTCLSDVESKNDEDSLLLPTNTVIPYAKILGVCLVEEDETVDKPASDVDPDTIAQNGEGITSSSSYFGERMNQMDQSRIPYKSAMIEVTFAKPRRNDLVPKKIRLQIDTSCLPKMEHDIAEEIMRRSYKNTKRNKSLLVLINPNGGKGKANKLFLSKAKPLLVASGCSVEITETSYHRHAIDIAREIEIEKYDVIACASGDGIPHEVINGLFQRSDRAKAFQKLAITQLPCGSGNAMSISCHGTSNPSYAALSLLKSVESRIDVMCCTQPSYRDQPRLSFLSQTYGLIAESDINTEFMRFLGPARFELGVTMNVLQRKKYPCDIYVKYAAKSKNELKSHYLEHKERLNVLKESFISGSTSSFENRSKSGGEECDTPELDFHEDITITDESFHLKWSLDQDLPSDWERIDPNLTNNTGIFYTGKMPYIAPDTKFFPAALPDDGTLDFVLTDARTPITRIAPILMSLDKGSHVLQPEVEHSKILAFRLIPYAKNSVISVDGENFPYELLQVEILPKIVKTLLKNGNYVDTDFESM